MKKTVIILSIFELFVGGCGQVRKIQTGTVNAPVITIENFIGKWLREFRIDEEVRTYEQHFNDEEGAIEKDVLLASFELLLEKDSTKDNALKGWHCVVIRRGAQIDCDDDDEKRNREKNASS